MFLITVRAYSDYDISYNIPVIVVGNYKKSNEIINITDIIIKKLTDICKNNYVFVYDDIFNILEVVEL